MSSMGLESGLLTEPPVPIQPIENRNSNRVILFIVLACSWLIAAFIFSLPFREGPKSIQGMDFIAVGKLVSRIGSLAILAAANLMLIRQKSLTEILPLYIGFLLFALWSAASVTWSALPELSAGQVLSFGVMLLLSFAIAQSVNTLADVKLVLFSLNGLLLLRSMAMVGMYFVVGPTVISRESDSYFHSTEAAETAAPSLVLLIGSVACIRDVRLKLLLIPGLLVYGALFVIAQNRLSLVTTPMIIGLILMSTGNRRLLVKLLFAGCLIVPAYILMDPGLEMISKSVGSTEQYAMRDDDGDAFSTLSGRTEMWAAIGEEITKSPIRGHGFFVSSANGELDVWGEVLNYTAHNQLLQVLVTTGIIGLGLFLLALWIPFTLLLKSLASRGERKRLAMVISFVMAWMVCWSTLNSSFSGALGSISITFYILLGLTVGGLRDNRLNQTDQRPNVKPRKPDSLSRP